MKPRASGLVCFLLPLLISTAVIDAREIPFYVGTSSAPGKQTGILRCTLGETTGKVSHPVLAADAKSPSFLAIRPGGRFLYAAIEAGNGAVAAFQILKDLSLVPLNIQPADGKGTCHVWAGATHVFASNYTGGNVACFPVLPDGSLGDAAVTEKFSGSGPNPVRQTAWRPGSAPFRFRSCPDPETAGKEFLFASAGNSRHLVGATPEEEKTPWKSLPPSVPFSKEKAVSSGASTPRPRSMKRSR